MRATSWYLTRQLDPDLVEHAMLNSRATSEEPTATAAADVVADGRLLVTATEAARMCSMHVNTWHRWMREGRCPAPMHQGRRSNGTVSRSLFAVEDLRAWVGMGMPDRATFERRRAEVRR